MPSRGTYRGVYSSLVDDLDFQQLTPEARLVFHTIRVSSQIGPAGIFRYYIGPLSEQSGLSERKVERCLQELERPKPRQTLGWIVREGGILWVVNALRYDPNMHLRDEKHLKSVLRALSSLPQQKIVLRFCDWYRITPPFTKDEMMISHPSSDHLFASNSNVSKVSRSGDITSCNTRESERPFDGPSEGLREKSESDSPRTSMRTKKTEDEKEDDGSDRTPPASAALDATPPEGAGALDPVLKSILIDCPHLSLVSNGASSGFWDQVLGACEPYTMADSRWLGTKLRVWDQWFESNPSRRSRDRKRLESRLMSWLSRDLEQLARRRA